jgi:predicted phosphodiesterase
MRWAILSDIHGHLTALEAVVADIDRLAPDLVLHGGDVAVIGPWPAQTIDLLRSRGWLGVLGNTDEVLFEPLIEVPQRRRAPKLARWLGVLFETLTPWARDRLNDDHIRWLRSLPRDFRYEHLYLTHAAPGDLWRAPMPNASDRELHEMYGPLNAALVGYGHIHRPYVRSIGELTVANCGSVGLPYDGDWRASYLLIDEGRPIIRRVDYDIDRACADLAKSGFPLAPWLETVLRSGHFMQP